MPPNPPASREWSAIADHGMLSDCRTAALIDRRGVITWWCPRRFDAASVFASLLDPSAGHWAITALDELETARRYVDDTMVLERVVRTTTGRAVLFDALDLGSGRGHDIGHHVPHALVRRIEVVEGSVRLALELAPRPDYGALVPDMRADDDGVVVATPDGDLRLRTSIAHRVVDGVARAHVELRAGERVDLTLAPVDDGGVALGGIDGTIEAWRSWATLHMDDKEPPDPVAAERSRLVRRSALVLQSLTYAPTGAIVAAPTTSLPEVIGGTSNWDYRYAWLRDAAFTVHALAVATCIDEVESYLRWMAATVCGADDDGSKRIVAGIDETSDLTERELPHLRGHRDSAPVRVGNDAWRQRQLDVAGEVLDVAWELRDRLDDLGLVAGEPLGPFLCDLAGKAADSWREPDSGIWEGREGERHYLSSKVMSWVALDRAARLAGRLGPDADPERWASEAEAVRAKVLERGWHDGVGAYTGAYDSDHLDASVLLMPLVGFVPADDERMRATIEVVAERLTVNGLVIRWSGPEGAGDDRQEGAFVICSCWLVECLVGLGERARATSLFARVVAHVNDLGLLSEEIDPRTGELLGNFPQGLSHVGLVNAAAALDGRGLSGAAAGVAVSS